MSNLKTIFSSLLVGFLVIAGSTYAAAPACPATTPGCNPPINVSSNNQTKNGGFGLGGNFGLILNKVVDFNSVGTGRSTPESQIGAVASNLNIYGGGSAAAKTRKVTIFDSICDSAGVCKTVTEIVTGGGGTSGVSQITAGTNVTISPTTGTGNVTVNASLQTETKTGSISCQTTTISAGFASCSGSATCSTGYKIISGGCALGGPNAAGQFGAFAIYSSYPSGSSWRCAGASPASNLSGGTAYAICAR
ncbi:MAG: hypothetical protein WCW56_00200 [Candidatus Paceibacterota bacterium]|jgi:hypothetical protein